MKYKILEAFIDKNTGKPYNPGAEYNTDDEARAAELQAGGYISKPNVAGARKKKPPNKAAKV